MRKELQTTQYDRKLSMYEKPEKREVMVKTNPDGKYNEVDVVKEKGNLRQVRVEQFLKVLGYKSIAAEHDLHRGAREDKWDEDIVMYGDDRDMTDAERFRSQPTRAPMGKLVVGDRQVTKFYLRGWKTEQEKDGGNEADGGHAMKEMSDIQADIEDLKGTLKTRSFGDTAFGIIPDKDPSKDKVH